MNQHEAIVYSITSISASIAITLIAFIMRKYCKDSKCKGYGMEFEAHNHSKTNSPKNRPVNVKNELDNIKV